MQKLLSLCAVLALAAPFATSQVDLTNGLIALPSAPVHAGTYYADTGVFLPGELPPPPTGPEVTYDNTFTNGFFFQPGVGIVNMDWGTLSAGGNNDILEVEIHE